ncbi:hypothetical protein [Xanthovirga aplysinae]|uniref:hypothetical protein n=1 Tax=Xanthovirga aplysinae TaxID=2529853 RepID=UPI0012BCACFE|nr:hypothetical protein [Xanthovirga aplysinae]MTI30814.1 hypothetical protein [Xanthovirga aplysinae]
MYKFLLIIMLLGYQINLGQSDKKFMISIPTAEKEAEYVWSLIEEISFYEKNGYALSLPYHPLIDSLVIKSKNKQLVEEDYVNLLFLMKEKVYKKSDYELSQNEVLSNLVDLQKMLKRIKKENWSWSFKEFERYEIKLTLYGPGGSYNPDEGSILLFTTKEGTYKNYSASVPTLIHEIVHLGIEESIVGKYELSHWTKERIVDKIVVNMFGDELPEYKIQSMGNQEIDQYLMSLGDLGKLDQVLESYLNLKN